MNTVKLIDEISQIVNIPDKGLWYFSYNLSNKQTMKVYENTLKFELPNSKLYIPSDNKFVLNCDDCIKFIDELNADKDFPCNKWRLPTLDELKVIDFNHSRIFRDSYENKYIYPPGVRFWCIIDENRKYCLYNFNDGYWMPAHKNLKHLMLICNN